jgi:hypothetical protein
MELNSSFIWPLGTLMAMLSGRCRVRFHEVLKCVARLAIDFNKVKIIINITVGDYSKSVATLATPVNTSSNQVQPHV